MWLAGRPRVAPGPGQGSSDGCPKGGVCAEAGRVWLQEGLWHVSHLYSLTVHPGLQLRPLVEGQRMGPACPAGQKLGLGGHVDSWPEATQSWGSPIPLWVSFAEVALLGVLGWLLLALATCLGPSSCRPGWHRAVAPEPREHAVATPPAPARVLPAAPVSV